MEAIINPNRKIGIEIEVVVPIIGVGENRDVQRLLAEVLTNNGIQSSSRGYTRQPVPAGSKFAIEHDVSLRDESRYAGLRWSKIEAKTAPMTWDEIEQVLPPALDIIKYVGARANYSCGLHVHHHLPEAEQRPEVVRNLQHLWWRFHPVMYGLVAPSRKSNQYCYAPQQADATQYDACTSFSRLCGLLQQVSRFNGLNLTNLGDSGRLTVEWRLHGGTTDWDKIKAWNRGRTQGETQDVEPRPVRGIRNLRARTDFRPHRR
ncbi:MAG: amidoligase family protein [Phycisphaerae bacterium]|nr:amidoligase family protein [Phycisphaerae bacterium]